MDMTDTGAREIVPGVHWVGAVDWDRRLFDALIPLPDGTSYNAYLITGEQQTALLDTVDPTMAEVLLQRLQDVAQIDYVISHHAEQDHSGAIPQILERYPQAQVLCTPKAQPMLDDLLGVPAERCRAVADEETLDLGGKTLQFLHTPWVHWPETMVSWLPEDRVLFPCDFLGAHLATHDLQVDWSRVHDASKRYYGEIMMPFAPMVARHAARLRALKPRLAAPAHGPVLTDPQAALTAWEDWAAGPPRNLAVIAYASMHGSTERMVDYLADALQTAGVTVYRADLSTSDLGELATALVDAGTIILGTPTVLTRPHPLVASAALLANALKPKARFAAVIGSYGWGGRAVESLVGLLSDLNLELFDPVLCQGTPTTADLQALSSLAQAIAHKHAAAGFAAPDSP